MDALCCSMDPNTALTQRKEKEEEEDTHTRVHKMVACGGFGNRRMGRLHSRFF